MADEVATLAGAIEKSQRLLVITGAGVSAASGLSTFRGTDPGAIWSNDVVEIGTFRWFRAHPVEWWIWFLDRFDGILDARPNPAHDSIAALERWQRGRDREFLLVTQNVDTLHERAGSRELVKVHGSADRVRCARFGCANGSPRGSLPVDAFDFTRLRRDPCEANLPRCPDCEAPIRAHALLFDEFYDEHRDYGFSRVQEALFRCDLAVFVGTSFSVGVTDLATRTLAGRGVSMISIDPVAIPPLRSISSIPMRAEAILPEALLKLTGESSLTGQS